MSVSTSALSLLPADFPYLSSLLLILLGSIVLIRLLPVQLAAWIALFASISVFIASSCLVFLFDNGHHGFQFVEQYPWINALNIHYSVGIDGISILFLPATSLLFTLTILTSWNAAKNLKRLYFTLLLTLQSLFLGIFMALDTILFFLFWELSIIPFYFLISLWGIGPERRYAAIKYTLFMLTGGVALLIAFILLATQSADNLQFDYVSLLQTSHDHPLQTAIFFLLLFGFAVKTPIFPFHTWLPVAASEGPAAIITLIVGLKLGAYGLLRFTLPLAPDAALNYQWLLIGLGAIGMVYGATMALSQTNLRRMLAFASLSHISLVVMGLATMNLQGIQGAVFQLLNFTLVSGGLFLLISFLHRRIGSTDVVSLGGVAKTMPLLASGFLLLGFASLGIPSTSGFPAELLLILSIFKYQMGAGLIVLITIILSASYFLSLYRRAFLGEATHATVQTAVDLRPRELLVLGLLLSPIFVFGVYPQAILELITPSTLVWVNALTP